MTSDSNFSEGVFSNSFNGLHRNQRSKKHQRKDSFERTTWTADDTAQPLTAEEFGAILNDTTNAIYLTRLERFLAKYVDRESAKDLAQDAWERILRKIAKRQEPVYRERLFGFAAAIGRGLVANHFRCRRRRRIADTVDADQVADARAGDDLERWLMLDVISRLDPDQQQVLYLTHLGWDARNIAAAMKITPGNVRVRRFKAISIARRLSAITIPQRSQRRRPKHDAK